MSKSKIDLSEVFVGIGIFWIFVILLFAVGYCIEKHDNYERQKRRVREAEEAMLVNIDLHQM